MTLSWSPQADYTSYTLYMHTGSDITTTTFTEKRDNLTDTAFTWMGLTPGATYYFLVTATNDKGESVATSVASGTPTYYDKMVSNASTDWVAAGSIQLNWTNPTGIAGVMVRRSATGYPATHNDGTLLYDGILQTFTDTGLTMDQQNYYSIFAYDSSANFGDAVHLDYRWAPVADTGQTQCYYYNGSSWIADEGCTLTYTVGDANYPYGQDAHYANIPVARSFTGPTADTTYTSDYTTKDNVTGLTWQSCSIGQSGADCLTGLAATYTWDNAQIQCTNLNSLNSGAGYAGRTNWRLPTIEELNTLPNYSIYYPAIDAGPFPATVAYYYWSSSTYVSNTSSAWYVYFYYGYTNTNSKTYSNYVRCVSSGL